MNIKIIKNFSIFLLIVLFSALSLHAEGVSGRKARALNRTFGEPANTHFNINKISTWIYYNGDSDLSQAGNSGFIFPKGSNKAVFYESGFVWGGKVQGEIRVGGSTYSSGVLPGRVVNGVPADPDAPDSRLFRVRPDYATASLASELADGDGASVEDIRAQYELDWNNWPAEWGAPFEDVDADGVYDPTVDIPGVPGADQTIWFVANDFDAGTTQLLYGSDPMGVEVQYTYWGYNTTGALGSTMFRKYLIINKNPDGLDFTDMYVSMWSDPDLGDASDDFVGCDTTLSLGYVYNANAYDAQYEFIPPAGGFDFFQGPIVDGDPTDEAIYKGKVVAGKKNLPMSAFYFFINSDAVYTDPALGETRGAQEFYNLFEGKISTTGVPFQDPDGNVTKFTLSGDPVQRTGWVDGALHPPGDRRMGQVAGPFTMAYGDTQEIVVAQMAAGAEEGIDRLSAVGLLKFYDLSAQLAYDNFFNVPSAPAAPNVNARALDNEIVLEWGSDIANVNATESHDESSFTFQGYNVYQLPSATASKSEGARVATYDIVDGVSKIEGLEFDPSTGVVGSKVLQFGGDSGVQRFISIKYDALKGGTPLINGTRYFFAVTSYAFNPDPLAVPNVLENPLTIVEVVPQSTTPGLRYTSETSEVLDVEHDSGNSDGIITPVVVDPTAVTGHIYKVSFTDDGAGSYTWNLDDQTAGASLLTDQVQNLGDAAPIVDGILVSVAGPDAGVKRVSELDANDETVDSGVGLYPGASLGPNGYIVTHLVHAGLSSANTHDRFGYWGMDDMVIDFTETSLSWDYMTEALHIDAATGQPSYVPFSMYRIKFPSGERERLFAGFYDTDGDGTWSIDAANWEDYGHPAYEPIFAWVGYDANGNEISYDPANEAQYIADGDLYTSAYTTWGGATGEFAYPWVTGTLFVMYREAEASLPIGHKVLFETYKPNTALDEFSFTAPLVTYDADLAKEDVIEEVNVFPNPYYGVNSQELNKYQRFVTFSHLPQNVTIRIFNLAGQLVRTIEKTDEGQFLRWDLMNQGGLPVASGLYIAYVDMPDLGTTKVLKVAIIQEQQILDRF